MFLENMSMSLGDIPMRIGNMLMSLGDIPMFLGNMPSPMRIGYFNLVPIGTFLLMFVIGDYENYINDILAKMHEIVYHQ